MNGQVYRRNLMQKTGDVIRENENEKIGRRPDQHQAYSGFEAIAATGSTIAAAVDLGISQSNTSRLLHQLEIYLGVRLFDRDKNRLSMTREG